MLNFWLQFVTAVECFSPRCNEGGYSALPKADARAEMFDGGFGYHTLWRNIPAYIERFDAQAMRRALDEASN
jgi:hypothetical protein